MDKIALCAIGRRENLYAREFVEHYKNLGFSNILILDNNHDGEEHFEDVLQDYINQGFVKIINCRNQINCQMRLYTETYDKYKDEYDWIAFFDFDEFLILPNHKTIGDFLEDKSNFDCVLINWMCMTDNNLVKYDPRPLMERFTQAMPINKPVQYSFPDNCHIKSIVKGHLPIVRFVSNPHIPTNQLNCCNAEGTKVNSSPWQQITYTQAYLKHFTTKTIEEWMTRKIKVGTPDRNPGQFLPVYRDRFFKVNEVTQDKLDYLKSIQAI